MREGGGQEASHLGMVLPANCIRAFTLDGESALGALGCEPIDPIGLAIGLTIRALHHGNVVFIKVAPTDGACQVILPETLKLVITRFLFRK